MRSLVLLLSLFAPITILSADSVFHIHGERTHNHPLPAAQGLAHRHVGGAIGESYTVTRHQKNESWLGKSLVEQTNWKAKINIQCLEKGKECGKIDFQALKCGGKLTLQEKNANNYIFTTLIEYGSCVQSCKIHLRSDGSSYKESCNNRYTGGGSLVRSSTDSTNQNKSPTYSKKATSGNSTGFNNISNDDILSLLKSSSWEGVGTQVGGSTWKVIVDHKNGIFKVSYPSLSCSGELKYLPTVSSKERSAFTEVIISGKESCISGLRVEVKRLDSNILDFSWISGSTKVSIYDNGFADRMGLNHKIKKLAQAKLTRKQLNANSQTPSIESSWIFDRRLMPGAVGSSFRIPSNQGVLITLSTNNKKSAIDKSLIKAYKKLSLQNGLSTKHTLSVKIKDVYGGSSGHPAAAGTSSSGIAGIYACFLGAEMSRIGCLSWTDHTNKFAFVTQFINKTLMGSESHVTNLKPLVKRMRQKQAEPIFLDVNLLDEIKSKLPKTYYNKANIQAIEYGGFVSEVSKSGACYKCEAEINIIDISIN